MRQNLFSSKAEEIMDYAISLLEKALFDQFEVIYVDQLNALTRYANSTIHQNVLDHNIRLEFRASKNKKLASTMINDITPSAIQEAINSLVKATDFLPTIEYFQGFPEPEMSSSRTINASGPLLDEYQRAEIVQEAVNTAESIDKDVKLAGSVSIVDNRFWIVNSNGINVKHRITYNSFSVNAIAEKENKKGYGREDQYVRDPSFLRPAELTQKATSTAISSCFTKDHNTGGYSVIFSPVATSTIIRFLSFAFDGNSYHEGRSFLRDQIGTEIFDNKLTCTDEPLNPETILTSPIDGEGAEKKKVILIQDGIPHTILYDTLSAAKHLNNKSKTTGHKMPPISTYRMSNIPLNIVLKPRDSTLEEMVSETREGFFVNRLHYVNYVNRQLGIITGLTRDGIFYIKDGEITEPSHNFRFTDRFTSFLKKISLIGKEPEKGWNWIAPPIKVENFHFSGKSLH